MTSPRHLKSISALKLWEKDSTESFVVQGFWWESVTNYWGSSGFRCGSPPRLQMIIIIIINEYKTRHALFKRCIKNCTRYLQMSVEYIVAVTQPQHLLWRINSKQCCFEVDQPVMVIVLYHKWCCRMFSFAKCQKVVFWHFLLKATNFPINSRTRQFISFLRSKGMSFCSFAIHS